MNSDFDAARGGRAPRVSVCIPTYRGEAHLAAAIASVLGQSLTDLELLVVDDHSPDRTRDIVAGFDDARLVYVRNAANLGPQGNWNRCLALARGRYVKLLPHDDLLLPGCLERQAEVLDHDAAQQIALVFCARQVLTADGRPVVRRGYPLAGGGGRIAAAELTRRCIRRGTNLIGEPGAVLFRRSLANRVGPFDATNPYVIDLDYWFRLLAHGAAHYIDEPLAAFRVSGQSWSVALGTQQSADFRRFAARVAGRPHRPGRIDRLCGRLTPGVNNLLRLAFYRLYLK